MFKWPKGKFNISVKLSATVLYMILYKFGILEYLKLTILKFALMFTDEKTAFFILFRNNNQFSGGESNFLDSFSTFNVNFGWIFANHKDNVKY